MNGGRFRACLQPPIRDAELADLMPLPRLRRAHPAKVAAVKRGRRWRFRWQALLRQCSSRTRAAVPAARPRRVTRQRVAGTVTSRFSGAGGRRKGAWRNSARASPAVTTPLEAAHRPRRHCSVMGDAAKAQPATVHEDQRKPPSTDQPHLASEMAMANRRSAASATSRSMPKRAGWRRQDGIGGNPHALEAWVGNAGHRAPCRQLTISFAFAVDQRRVARGAVEKTAAGGDAGRSARETVCPASPPRIESSEAEAPRRTVLRSALKTPPPTSSRIVPGLDAAGT